MSSLIDNSPTDTQRAALKLLGEKLDVSPDDLALYLYNRHVADLTVDTAADLCAEMRGALNGSDATALAIIRAVRSRAEARAAIARQRGNGELRLADPCAVDRTESEMAHEARTGESPDDAGYVRVPLIELRALCVTATIAERSDPSGGAFAREVKAWADRIARESEDATAELGCGGGR
jgi:hypothetical protein